MSTDHQDIQRQTIGTETYVAESFDDPEVRVYNDTSTGTDTDRDDYQRLMGDVRGGEIDAVVVKSVSRICRSIRDLERTVDEFEDAGTALHIIDEGVTIKPEESDPFQKALLQLLGVFAELEASMTQQRVKEGIAARMDEEEYHHGPAPLGFEKRDGELYETPEYDRVCAVLQMVRADELSKRKAADRLDCARATISRALAERADLYGLDDVAPAAREAE